MAAGALVGELLARLDDDLGADAGGAGRAVHPAPPLARPLDPIAADYLVLGSRLGTEVLRRELMAQTPPVAIPSYFLACPAPQMWRGHCTLLDSIAPTSEQAEHLIRDVIAGYGVFRAAADAQPD